MNEDGFFVRYADYFSVDGSETGTIQITPSANGSGRVLKYSSFLSKSHVLKLARECSLPGKALLMLPDSEDRACSPPVGFITLYEDSLKNGLRLPLSPVIADLLRELGIPLAQLTPNSFKHIIALLVHIVRLDSEPCAGLIRRFFQFKNSEGWFYATPRLHFKSKTKTKIANWQRRFFFCRAIDVQVPELPWRSERVVDVDAGDFGDLENVLDALKTVDDISEADLSRVGRCPDDPVLRRPARGEALLWELSYP